MPADPAVSVVIPTYNRAPILKASINSVLAQTWTDFELLLVDDGSTDDTCALVKGIGDPRVRYIHQDHAGACAARNRGIDEARGEWIAFHDSDDTWRPDKLEKQMAKIRETQADVLLCKLAMHAGDTVTVYPKRIGEGFVSLSQDLFGVGTQTILARAVLCREERFDPEMPRYQDFEWLYRVVQKNKVYCLDQALVDYTVGADSISVDYTRMRRAAERLAEKYPDMPGASPLIGAHIVRNLGEGWVYALRCGDREGARAFRRLMRVFRPGIGSLLKKGKTRG